VDALVGLGDTYSDLGGLSEDPKDHEKAIEYYKRALAIKPGHSHARTSMAIGYSYLGMNDLAIKELKKAIKIDKDYYMAYFNLGLILYQEENLPEAKEYLQKVVELTKDRPQSTSKQQASSLIQQIDAQLKAHGDTPPAQ
jgi:tetratricopeptide (TPR) repeat protein